MIGNLLNYHQFKFIRMQFFFFYINKLIYYINRGKKNFSSLYFLSLSRLVTKKKRRKTRGKEDDVLIVHILLTFCFSN